MQEEGRNERSKRAKTEKDIWKYINEERKRKSSSLGKSITMEDCHKHFCEALQGRDEAVMEEKRNIGEDDEEEELMDGEIEQQNLKRRNKGV